MEQEALKARRKGCTQQRVLCNGHQNKTSSTEYRSAAYRAGTAFFEYYLLKSNFNLRWGFRTRLFVTPIGHCTKPWPFAAIL